MAAQDGNTEPVLAPLPVANRGVIDSMLNFTKRTVAGDAMESPTRARSNMSISRPNAHNLPMHVNAIFTIAIPVIVACINFIMVAIDVNLVGFKFDVMNNMFAETRSALTGGLALGGICAGYAAVSASLVLFLDPRSAGSGIPEAKGYLNGNAVDIFSFRALLVRSLGVVFTVAAGFPVGREGPMVGIGGCVGFAVVHTLALPYVRKWVKVDQSENEGFGTPALFMDEERFAYARRIGTVLGASAGIAVAFNAPIGGILYMFEEVTVTNWAPELTFRAFVGAVVAVLLSAELMKLLGSAAHSLLLFDPDLDPLAPKFFPIDWIFVAMISGLIGILSALFAKCMAGTWQLRSQLSQRVAKKGWYAMVCFKLFDAIFYALLCAVVFCLLPLAARCEQGHSSGGSSAGSMGSVASSAASGSGRLLEAFDVGDWGNGTDYMEVGDHHAQPRRMAGLLFRQYICDEGENNKIATLLLSGAEGAVKHLFNQSPESYIEPGYLAITGAVYFLMACGMPGLPIPMGCFVPSLLLGAISGRFCGEFLSVLAAAAGIPMAQPGAYSMAGAAAFLGGFTHMTIAIVALLVEAAKDLSILPMMMLAITVSHLASKLISHHGYDEILILKKGVPFLEAELPHDVDMNMTALELMDEYPDEAILPELASPDVVEDALSVEGVHIFPVLDVSGSCLGMVMRARLTVALKTLQGAEAGLNSTSSSMMPTKSEAAAQGPMGSVCGCLNPRQLLRKVRGEAQDERIEDCNETEVVDRETHMPDLIRELVRRPSQTANGNLLPVARLMDPCPYTVLESMPIGKFYRTFTCGTIQHAAVVSTNGDFRGILTRRNLISATTHSHAQDIPKKLVSGNIDVTSPRSPSKSRRERGASNASSASAASGGNAVAVTPQAGSQGSEDTADMRQCSCGNMLLADSDFCRKCGKQYDAEAKANTRQCACGNAMMADSTFCRKCGKQYGDTAAQADTRLCDCGNVLMADSTFCRKCGEHCHAAPKADVRHCECGNALLPDSEFCRNCGKKAAAEAPAEAPADAPAVPTQKETTDEIKEGVGLGYL